jgi:hypothetical protein
MRPRKKVSRTDQSKNTGQTLSYALRLKHERTSVHEGLYVRILLRADLREVPAHTVNSRKKRILPNKTCKQNYRIVTFSR